MSVALANDSAASRFESLRASRLFPGRKCLYVFEIARALQLTQRHVIDLIEEGEIAALDLAGSGNKTDRCCYRIPVCEYDAYILRRTRIGVVP